MVTTEIVIERLIDKFGDEYDYSLVNYVNAKTKICIVCPKHGKFYALVGNLLQGKGCPKCRYEKSSKKQRHTLNEIKERVEELYGDKYDLSLIDEYKNISTKYPIICKFHGVFYTTINALINKKQGCPSCSGNKKYTFQSFLQKAQQMHNNKYQYKDDTFNGMRNKMAIICPKHGEFLQTPHEHLQGQGCPQCGRNKIGESKRSNTQEFIKKFNIKTNNFYDTSKVEYVNSRTKVCVICPIHGEFWATPNNLLSGKGCPKCGKKKIEEYNIKNRKYTTEEFIQESKKVHGERFEYEKTVYNGMFKKCVITCKKHGDFETLPSNFLKGHGCPNCNESRLEKEIDVFLTNNKIDYVRQKRYGTQFVDFYLPEQNIVIECQGKQHFIKTQFGNTPKEKLDEIFDYTVSCDVKKNKLLKEKGINVVYYSWKRIIPKNIDHEFFGNIYKDGIILNTQDLIEQLQRI